MKRIRSGGLALFSAIVLVSTLPTTAMAGPGHFVWPAMHSSKFTLPASNGYRIQVTDTGDRQIYLTAENGGSSVIYTVRGRKAGEDGIEARLPGVGRISVRFEQVGKTRHAPPTGNCTGEGSKTERGVFRGTIVFNGEKGFATARASRAGGTVRDSGEEICPKRREEKGGPDLHTTFLNASAPRGRGLLSFLAVRFSSDSTPAHDQTQYSASFFQLKGRMSVYRTVSRGAAGESFAVSGPGDRPTAASVAPPPPFAGKADFTLGSKSMASWTGPLSVDLPGLGPVDFAGPRFSAELCLDARPCYGAGDSHDANFVTIASASEKERVRLGQRLPVPGFRRGQALLVQVVPELR